MEILLVDDERLARVCTQAILEELLPGIDVHYHHASGAAQARAWIGEHGAPDLGFVDYKMPRCNGVELLLEIRALCLNTIWVLLSGYDMACEEENIRRCGLRFVLAKPAGVDDLSRVLHASGLYSTY